MHKIATIHARIEPALKTKAELILNQLGLSSAEAVRLFYKQICLRKGLPFEIRIPNRETIQAMHDIEAGRTKKAKNVDALFADLNKNASR